MKALTWIFAVNERSILSRKRRALRRSRTLAHDTETQEYIQPSRISKIASQVKAPFTRNFWEDALEPSEDETLVDSKLLSYAYLEAGMIEMMGAWVLQIFPTIYDPLIILSPVLSHISSYSTRRVSPPKTCVRHRQLEVSMLLAKGPNNSQKLFFRLLC